MVENNNPQAFLSYVKLDVRPHQVHKSKDEHRLAVFELSKGIADLLRDDDCSIFQRIYDGLERMCNQFKK